MMIIIIHRLEGSLSQRQEVDKTRLRTEESNLLTKDVDQYGFDLLVRCQDLECLDDLQRKASLACVAK